MHSRRAVSTLRPCALLWACFVAGIASGEGLRWRLAGTAFLGAFLWPAVARRVSWPALLLLVFTLGLWRGSSLNPAEHPLSSTPRPVIIQGRVILPPARRPHLPFWSTTLTWEGHLIVLSTPFEPSVKAGDRIEVRGTFRSVFATANPGDTFLRRALRARRFTGYLSAVVRDQIVVTARRPTLLDRARSFARTLLTTSFQERVCGLVLSVTLGDRRTLHPDLKQDFRHAGMAHILAISGLHVGLVAWFCAECLRRCAGSRAAAAHLALLAGAGAAWGYALFAGLPPSAARAALGASALSVILLFSRTPDLFALLLAVSGLILCVDPALLYSPSFQLSVSAVLGIVRLGLPPRLPPLARRLRKRSRIAQFLTRSVGLTMRVSAAAFLGAAPWMAFHFGSLHPWATAASVFACPLLAAGLGSCAVGIALSALWLPLGTLFFWAASLCFKGLIGASAFFASLPAHTCFLPPLPLPLVLCQVACLLFELQWIRLCGPVLLFCAFFLPHSPALPHGGTVFHLSRGVAVFFRTQSANTEHTLLYLRGPSPSYFPGLLRYNGVGKVTYAVMATPGAQLPISAEHRVSRSGLEAPFGSGSLHTYTASDGSLGATITGCGPTVCLGRPPPSLQPALVVAPLDPLELISCEAETTIVPGTSEALLCTLPGQRVISVPQCGAVTFLLHGHRWHFRFYRKQR